MDLQADGSPPRLLLCLWRSIEREESTASGERAKGDGWVPKENGTGLKCTHVHIFVCKNPKLKLIWGTHMHFLKNILSSLILKVLVWTK